MLGGGTDHTMHMTPFDLITVSEKTEVVTSERLENRAELHVRERAGRRKW